MNATHLATYKKEYAKVRSIILDGFKDHIVPHISELDMTKKMWDTILNQYQNTTTNRKMILREKLKNTQINQGKDVTSYLTWLKLVKDEFAGVGDSPGDDELVRIALNGFTKKWNIFVKVISG